ncbi:hypothetical protein GCM10009682_38230 [Luedemannella flava]|uniref:DUF4350 domain-containing protein n=1 Tax=Luedemannella flava TaxID=349316 RepID=A0ABP4YHH3_9ACTN
MRERLPAGWVRWLLLGLAATFVIIFLAAQYQSANVHYGELPERETIAEGSAGELTDATLPSVEQMTAMVAANPVVRLDGAVAVWDAGQVAAVTAGRDVRILVAPPGLTEEQRQQVNDVENATITIIGTRVTGDMYVAVGDRAADWRAQFGRNDVTSALLTLIPAVTDQPDVDGYAYVGAWRAPTKSELDPVAADLRATGAHLGTGATLTSVPRRAAAEAFGTDDALVVALPAQPLDRPAPDYGPALAALFPGRPLVVMYGNWIEYHGPHADEFAEIASAGFYARFGDRLSRFAYPQANVLGVYLGRVADIRTSGLFDKPPPYRPFDPLRVALPALPWLFAACVLGFLALSGRTLLRPALAAPARFGTLRGAGLRDRLAALTALAVEISGLPDARDDEALTRAIGNLVVARESLDDNLPDRVARSLLNDAHRDLDEVARRLPYPGLRPDEYLRGRLA